MSGLITQVSCFNFKYNSNCVNNAAYIQNENIHFRADVSSTIAKIVKNEIMITNQDTLIDSETVRIDDRDSKKELFSYNLSSFFWFFICLLF